jgi:hypothetical protein
VVLYSATRDRHINSRADVHAASSLRTIQRPVSRRLWLRFTVLDRARKRQEGYSVTIDRDG